MIRHTRGETVTFTNVFYDIDGVATTPDSASVVVIYPTTTPSTSELLTRDPGQLKGKETIVMTVDDDGLWSCTWDSSVSDPGVVYYSIKSTGTGAIVIDGMFVLEGNLANLETL